MEGGSVAAAGQRARRRTPGVARVCHGIRGLRDRRYGGDGGRREPFFGESARVALTTSPRRRARLQRRCRPRGTHRSWNAAIKAAHGNGPGGGDTADSAAPRYVWQRLDAAEVLARHDSERIRRRAVEAAAAGAVGRGVAPSEELCVTDLLAVLCTLARAAAGLSVGGVDLATTRRRALEALRGFGAAHSGISTSRLGQVLGQAEGFDLIPEMAGGGAPLGRIGAELICRVEAAALTLASSASTGGSTTDTPPPL